MSKSKPPLAGIRVVDFTRYLAGPFMTLILADMGAEVIKIEEPKMGDESRNVVPFMADGKSSFFVSTNRLKKSVAIDLKHREGRHLARELALKADVLAENFRPGVMARLGLDYDSLKVDNPGLVYCAISGFGHASPLREAGGYDPIAQAEGGLMALTGEADGPALRAGGGVMDTFTGAMAGNAVLAALLGRAATGRGEFLDISLLDCTLASVTMYAQAALASGEDPPRLGNRSPYMAPMDAYDCADGQLMVIAGSERQFRVLCEQVLEKPELVDDPRFRTMADRAANSAALEGALAAVLRTRTRQEWLDRMRPIGISVGAVRPLTEALATPEVEARGILQEVRDGTGGSYRTVGTPLFFTEAEMPAPEPAPQLGADTDAVLAAELGCSAKEIKRLRTARAIG